MLLESLARLVLVNEECKERGVILNSAEFMKDTDVVIKQQIEILQNDLQFQVNNPGPYTFGLGNRSIVIFTPSFTETSEWAMIIFNEETQTKEEVFIFHTIYGLIENLSKAFKYIENVNTEVSKSQPETGSVQTNTTTNI